MKESESDVVAKRIAEKERAAAELLIKLDQRKYYEHTDYLYDKTQHAYWDKTTRTLQVAQAVDASIPMDYWRVAVVEAKPEGTVGRPSGKEGKEKRIKPSYDLSRVENDWMVEGSTWAPGYPEIIRNLGVGEDGLYEEPGLRLFNTYLPPAALKEEEGLGGADIWVDHVKALWPTGAEYFLDYCAHMIQKPHEKCCAALVLSGKQGIGKDAALVPLKKAVGPCNSAGIDPDQLFSAYKPWSQVVMLVIDEVRPHKDEFRTSSLYNILKPLIAAPPYTLPVEQKFEKLRYVMNVCRVFITTNELSSMYIPPDDRRLAILHSDCNPGWAAPEYFKKLFSWFHNEGGNAAVRRYLMGRDITKFDPSIAPEKTMAWRRLVTSWENHSSILDDAFDRIGRPDIVFSSDLLKIEWDENREVRAVLRSGRKLFHQAAASGYETIKPKTSRFGFRENGKEYRSAFVFASYKITEGKSEDEVNRLVNSEIARRKSK